MKRLAIALATLAAALLAPGRAQALPPGTHVQLFKGGLNQVVDMAHVPGTEKLFFTEKNTGKIRVILHGRLLATACANLDVVSDGERGALGLALDPRYRQTHFLYVYFTKHSPLENRVTRFTVRHNRCIHPHPLITGIPTVSGYHNGGQLLFHDGELFVTVGEGHDAANAQRLNTWLGKVLRETVTQHPRRQSRAGRAAAGDLVVRAPKRVRAGGQAGHAPAVRDRERAQLRRRAEPDPPRPQLRLG